MGPGDPFFRRERAESQRQGVGFPNVSASASDAAPSNAAPSNAAPSDVAPSPPARRDLTSALPAFIAVGLLVGIGFGLVVVLRGLLAALVLAVFSGVGAGVAALVWAAMSGKLDIKSAIDGLLGRRRR